MRDTIVKKLAVKPMLLMILIARKRAAFGDGNSNVSKPVKCSIGRGIHMKHNVNNPMPVVHALENMMDLEGPIGDIAQARALYKTS